MTQERLERIYDRINSIEVALATLQESVRHLPTERDFSKLKITVYVGFALTSALSEGGMKLLGYIF